MRTLRADIEKAEFVGLVRGGQYQRQGARRAQAAHSGPCLFVNLNFVRGEVFGDQDLSRCTTTGANIHHGGGDVAAIIGHVSGVEGGALRVVEGSSSCKSQ